MSNTQQLAKVPHNKTKEMLLWFAVQDATTHVDILKEQKTLLDGFTEQEISHDDGELRYQCLLLAIQNCGWQAERDFIRGKALSDDSARQISINRKRRAKSYQARRVQVRAWLDCNWGKVLEYHRADLGWRAVSKVIFDEHGIKISHTTLWRYYGIKSIK